MASTDLHHWQEPLALQLKGPAVPVRDTGRALDPYLFRDKDDPDLWWCCYKHGGVLLGRAHGLGFGGTPIPPDNLLLQSMQLSFSRDLEHWTPYAQTDGEENYCVLVDRAEDEYLLVHSPANGIGIKRSTDLVHWYDELPLHARPAAVAVGAGPHHRRPPPGSAPSIRQSASTCSPSTAPPAADAASAPTTARPASPSPGATT